jgi:acyl transferase domain-containing protein
MDYQERLKNKDELIAHYREKLALQPKDKEGVSSRARKREIREQLSVFWTEGNQYAESPASTPESRKAIAEWAEKVENYLKEHLDSSYATRFHMQRVIPPETEPYKKVYVHLDHLEDFMKELAVSSLEK